jgi:hypothetical protein
MKKVKVDEPEIIISPFMAALEDWRVSSAEDKFKYAAGIELEIRKLIMGGIGHVENVRLQLMNQQFKPFDMPGQPTETDPSVLFPPKEESIG